VFTSNNCLKQHEVWRYTYVSPRYREMPLTFHVMATG